MILDPIVRPSFDDLGNLCPVASIVPIGEKQFPFFLIGPLLSVDVGVELIIPSLPALLA